MSPERGSRATQVVGWLAFGVGLGALGVYGLGARPLPMREAAIYGAVALFGALLIDSTAVTRAVRGVLDAGRRAKR